MGSSGIMALLHLSVLLGLSLAPLTRAGHGAPLSPAFSSQRQIVPFAGNAFRTAPSPGDSGLFRDGAAVLRDADDVVSVFFHCDRAAVLTLSIRARCRAGRSTVSAETSGQTFTVSVDQRDLTNLPLGRVRVSEAGYVRVDFQSANATAGAVVELRDLLVAAESPGLAVRAVTTNEGNMFYWGRRGPSVHLRYDVPDERPLQYAYSEVTVPPGEDPIGSFVMANGFAEGYFGMQVNGPDERRVLFSVWSPYRTDDPREIPEDQRVVALSHGPTVTVREFGNEGSGGQSFLRYRWQAGTTYRFLTEVQPVGDGHTIYSAWFGEVTGDAASEDWRLIAAFRRPRTDTHLRGFHSFVENFRPEFGHRTRHARFRRIFVRDAGGKWHACTAARFSVDATGAGGHRLDYAGGVIGGAFFLKNGGFFSESARPGETFRLDAQDAEEPQIEFAELPR